MRRVGEYVGKPIVSADTGEKVGTVADVLVDADAGRIVGVIVGGGLLTSEHVLPYADVQVMGIDAVIAKSRQHIVAAREWRKAGSDAARAKTCKWVVVGSTRVRTDAALGRSVANDVRTPSDCAATFQLECVSRPNAVARSPAAPISAVNTHSCSAFAALSMDGCALASCSWTRGAMARWTSLDSQNGRSTAARAPFCVPLPGL